MNYLLEHKVIVTKKYNNTESYCLNDNAQTLDWIEIPPSCTPTSIDPNTLQDSPNISTIGTPTCSNLPSDCPSQLYSLTSLKQNYIDLFAQSVDVKEFLFRELCSWKSKTKLEIKVFLLEKENFELRSQLVDKLLIIKQLKTDSKSNPFPTDLSSTTNTITTPIQINDNINSNNDNNNKNNINNNNINNNNCKYKNNDNSNNKNKKNHNSTNEKAVYNKKLQAQLQEIRKEKHIHFFKS